MKKVLFVCGQEFILDQTDGGKKCSYRNFTMLQDVYGKKNAYAYIFTNDFKDSDKFIRREKSHTSLLAKICDVFTLHAFSSAKQEKKLIDYVKQENFDIVFLERSLFGPLVKKLNSLNIETQIFVENIEKYYVWNKVKKQNPFLLLPFFFVKLNENMTLKYADKIICLTDRDSKLVKKLYNRNVSAIIPMTFKDRFSEEKHIRVKIKKEKILLFIGSNFPPNYDGIKWFIENVMSELEDYTLLIVGKGFEKKSLELQKKNVKVIGTVQDLEQYYYTNYAMVMPILYGDGIKIKTAEAMMYGKIMFASDEALEGYELEGVDGIYRCNTSEEYVKNIRFVFRERTNMGYVDAVRKTFLEKYENTVAVKKYLIMEK